MKTENLKQSGRRILALAGKELYSMSYSVLLYGITLAFLLFSSIWLFFYQRFFSLDSANLRPFFSIFPLSFILVIPVLTMKSWAEERKVGSLELLLTMPFSEWEMVLGKFLSCLAAFAAMLALTIPVPLSLLPLGQFEAGVIFAEYCGALLLGSSAISLGLLLSALARNQGGAFLGSAIVLLAVTLIGELNFMFNLPWLFRECINSVSLTFHYESFSKGILYSSDVVYFILTSFLFLFLNTRVILFRKWS